MSQITFSEEDVKAIGEQRYQHPDPRVARHMEILWLKSYAANLRLTHDAIALLAGCSRRTVQRTLADFRDGGLQKVKQIPSKRSNSEMDKHRTSLEEIFTKDPPRSVKHARRVIWEETGIKRGLTQVRHFLLSLGLKPRKVAASPIPPKSDISAHVADQKAFLTNKLEPKLKEARTGKRQVLFVDAAHFVHSTILGILRCVARMCVRATSERKRFNVLGALDAVTHKLIGVTNHSYINGQSVCELLRGVGAMGTPGIPITLVLDNAPYQKSCLDRSVRPPRGKASTWARNADWLATFAFVTKRIRLEVLLSDAGLGLAYYRPQRNLAHVRRSHRPMHSRACHIRVREEGSALDRGSPATSQPVSRRCVVRLQPGGLGRSTCIPLRNLCSGRSHTALGCERGGG